MVLSVLYSRAIIPADAGSTYLQLWASMRMRDHPRGCGEHYNIVCWYLSLEGSSPRMRGALIGYLLAGAARGIIPADAGSTFGRVPVLLSTEDHPRGCGEHILLGNKVGADGGSSPRMRGAPRRCHVGCR